MIDDRTGFDRTEFGVTYRSIAEMVARVATNQVNHTDRLVQAYVGGAWVAVTRADPTSGIGWDIATSDGFVLFAPYDAVVFRFEPNA